MLEVIVEFEAESAKNYGIIVRQTPDRQKKLGCTTMLRGKFAIDRTKTGLEPDVLCKGVQGGAVDLAGENPRFHLFLDKSMLEVYPPGPPRQGRAPGGAGRPAPAEPPRGGAGRAAAGGPGGGRGPGPSATGRGAGPTAPPQTAPGGPGTPPAPRPADPASGAHETPGGPTHKTARPRRQAAPRPKTRAPARRGRRPREEAGPAARRAPAGQPGGQDPGGGQRRAIEHARPARHARESSWRPLGSHACASRPGPRGPAAPEHPPSPHTAPHTPRAELLRSRTPEKQCGSSRPPAPPPRRQNQGPPGHDGRGPRHGHHDQRAGPTRPPAPLMAFYSSRDQKSVSEQARCSGS